MHTHTSEIKVYGTHSFDMYHRSGEFHCPCLFGQSSNISFSDVCTCIIDIPLSPGVTRQISDGQVARDKVYYVNFV